MVTTEQSELSCSICAKHRGEGALVGPMVWEDEDVLISHRPVGEDGTTVLGYLYVETRRHMPYLVDLTDNEAETIGRMVAHFHQHLFVRHAGTPSEYGWMAGDKWPAAPRGTVTTVADLCDRLRTYLHDDAGTA